MELSQTLKRIAGGHMRGNDANFLEGLIEASEIFGLFGTDEAKLIAFAEQWQGKAATLEPDQSISSSTNIPSTDEGRRDVFENARLASTTAERTRIEAILSDPVAQDRAKSAHHLAFNTELTADVAISLLQTIPAETAIHEFESDLGDFARSSNAFGGLAIWDAEAGKPVSASPMAINTEHGMSALIDPIEPTPDPHAAIRTTPEQKAKSLWQKAIGEVNAARGFEG